MNDRQFSGVERRAEPRSDYFARVQVCFQPEGSEPCTFAGMIEDRSKSGLGVRVRKPIPVGSKISVFHGSAILRCEVKRCVPSGMDFLLGMRVLPAEAAE